MKSLLSILLLITLAAGCSAGSPKAEAAASGEKNSQSPSIGFAAAELEAYEKGLAQETALVLAAKERGDTAKTAEARAAAAQDQWESSTIPGGAAAAGIPVERYRAVRKAVNRVLETLDFQGKIDGPSELDMEHATPEMKRRLGVDAFPELDPASASVLRARMGTLVPIWIRYMRLVAVNG